MRAFYVSILVLMEVTLKAPFCRAKRAAELCFNPCFNGSDSKRELMYQILMVILRFNPCFNGSDSKS